MKQGYRDYLARCSRLSEN